MPTSRLALLSGAATAALCLAAPAVAQGWVPAKPLARATPYVAGDMHNHTTCTDGSVSTVRWAPARSTACRTST